MLQLSKVCFRLCKLVCKLSSWLASFSSGDDHRICFKNGQILCCDVRNITVKS